MPVKKRVKKSRARKPVKKGLKQKQKQKQEQKVNVSVSAGGAGGGGTQFIPMPSQAPVFDYAQLANLIRPANTVDVPIRAQANPEPLPMRAAETQTLAEDMPKVGGSRPSIFGAPRNPFESGNESQGGGFERPTTVPGPRKGGPRGPYGSTKEKYINVGRNVQNEFAMGGGGSGSETESPRMESSSTGGGRNFV